MMKLVEIKKILKAHHIPIEYEIRGRLGVVSCFLGDNYYGYEDDQPPLIIDDKKLAFLEKDDRIDIIRCCDCFCCGSW